MKGSRGRSAYDEPDNSRENTRRLLAGILDQRLQHLSALLEGKKLASNTL
jgi:hypothetical protein